MFSISNMAFTIAIRYLHIIYHESIYTREYNVHVSCQQYFQNTHKCIHTLHIMVHITLNLNILYISIVEDMRKWLSRRHHFYWFNFWTKSHQINVSNLFSNLHHFLMHIMPHNILIIFIYLIDLFDKYEQNQVNALCVSTRFSSKGMLLLWLSVKSSVCMCVYICVYIYDDRRWVVALSIALSLSPHHS